MAQIRERNFNLDFKNPNAQPEAHEDPDELLARYQEARTAADAVREELKVALASALAETAGVLA